ncbi:hypothetical protein B0T36_17245 [Nocardia donostiensis]|uniref:hypothetical protein n=1 Tax=Nocardia donostiensis TaxID=1538463 RepID=UPI0009DAC718|nr:hypothetical protein [Nocardia donostiensis]OQS13878.1 hypothetical protein B0T36_17245 [Nocardia donostiensis]
MASEDKPDRLSPADRHQYENRYIPKKLAKNEIPRTPISWQQASSFRRVQWLQGKSLERGFDVVFGLPQSGWQAERSYQYKPDERIRIDRRLERHHTPDMVARNVEIKSGSLKDRDVQQLDGYIAKLREGEKVFYYTRASKSKEHNTAAREKIAQLEREFPDQFVHKQMSERVYQRILAVGARQVARDIQQRIENDLARLPEREPSALSVEQIARDYVRDIERIKAEGRHVGIEQLRYVTEALRELAAAEQRANHDQAAADRKALGLGYHAARDLAQVQAAELEAQHIARMRALDPLRIELIAREREQLSRHTDEMARQLPTMDLVQQREQFLGLAYTLGKIQSLEREHHQEIARDVPHERAVEFLREAEATRQEIDRPVAQQIGAIGAAVERETAARERAELSRLAIEVNRERLIVQGMDPEQARAQAVVLPAPLLRDSDRGKDPRELVREIAQRDREHSLARERATEQRVARLVARGVPEDHARAVVLVQLPSPPPGQRQSSRNREAERAEARLLEQGIAPEIARAAAEGRIPEPPPVVTRGHESPGHGRELGIYRDR